MSALLVALGIVFVAELGDKTQLVVVTLGARHRPAAALAALAVVAGLLMAIAVTVGAAVGAVVPDRVATAFAGVLFLGFALWTWREAAEEGATTPIAEHGVRDEPDADQPDAGADVDPAADAGGARRGVVAFAGAFFLAELGDKTQLTAASLATRNGALPTWLGATLGLVAATALALLAGRWLRRRIGARRLAVAGALAFAAFGAAALLVAALG